MKLDLAREILTHHARSRTNGIFPEGANRTAKLTNPICGDHVELRLFCEGESIVGAGHRARACAICSASASLLSQEIQGKPLARAFEMATAFENSLLSQATDPWPEILEGLKCFTHLRTNPTRRACALLPWIALRKALTLE